MKRWVRVASYFYPASWRRRYATEFNAMLDQVDAGWKDVLDILKGALTMQFTSWNFKSILLTFGVIGAAIAAAAAFRIPNQYQSMTVMRISPQNPAQDNGQMVQRLNEMEQEVLSRTSLAETITRFDLYKSQRKERPLEDIVQDMRNHDIAIKVMSPARGYVKALTGQGIHHDVASKAMSRVGTYKVLTSQGIYHDIAIKVMSPAGGRQDGRTAFSISYVYPDAKLAQAVTRELVTKFTEQNVTVERRGGIPTRVGENLEVLDPPSHPVRPIYPNRPTFVVTGLFLGLLAGLTMAFALRWRIAIVRRSAH